MRTRRRASEQTVDEGTVIVDIGGGSTELIAGEPDGVRWHDSLDIGSVRLTERFLHGDPPTPAELQSCAAAVEGLVAERGPDEVRRRTADATRGAGTITSLAALALGLEEYDRERVHGSRLTAAALAEQLERLPGGPLPGSPTPR